MFASPQICDFENLSWLIVVCHFFLPLLAIPLTFVLIPDAKLTDSLTVDENGKTVVTAAEKAPKAVVEGEVVKVQNRRLHPNCTDWIHFQH